MDLKIGETTIELINAPTISGNTMEFDFASDMSVEAIEKVFANGDAIKEYDGDALLETFKGFSNLLYIRKNVADNTFTICLSQPIITIKGISNTEEVMTLLKNAGYEID